MMWSKRGLFVGVMTLCAAVAAHAQDSGNSVIGPPQLRDFSLEPKQRIVIQPAPQVAPPAQALTPPAPSAAQPPRQSEGAPRDTSRDEAAQRATRRVEALPQRLTAAPAQRAPSSTPTPSTATLPPLAEPAPSAEAPAPADNAAPQGAPAAPSESSWSPWLYALPVAVLALLGAAVVRRRRRSDTEPVPETVPAVSAPPAPVKPRPDPIPRPWLELSLKAERATFTDVEAELHFELEISNQGGSAARNLRIDVKMFNGGAEQDKEIGAFFRTAGRESTKLNLPRVDAGVTGVIPGRVTLARDEIRAMQLDQKLLFIPVVAVNALYDWGEGRTGQTSKSYVIGRELQEPSEKMGPFRVDLGPRVWRTVGQRPHKLAKRV